MGTGANPLRKPGRLCHTPTDLSAAWPHGGTGLGNVTAAKLYVQTTGSRVVVAEEFGEVVETIKGGRSVWLAVSLRDWDADSLALVWSKTAGSISGNPLLSIPSTPRAGRLGSSDAKKILWTPRDQTNGVAVLLYAAIPELDEELVVRFSVFSEMMQAVVFRAVRNSSDNIAQIGTLADFTL